MSTMVWVDGSLVAETEAVVSATARGWTVGYGLFETLAAHQGTPFAFTRHYRRLEDGAQVVGLTVPPPEVLRDAAAEVLAANCPGGPLARLRITVGDGGRAPVVTVFATAIDAPAPAAAVVFSPFQRNPRSALTGIKATSYAENALAHGEARARGADEAILANTHGHLCEGTTSNVFLVRAGELRTAPLSSGCLPGVTRGLVLELAETAGIPVGERDLPCEALAEADEAFLTSATRGAQPIASVDGRKLPAAPGEVTKGLQEALAELQEKNADP